jgi:hypothetical protein
MSTPQNKLQKLAQGLPQRRLDTPDTYLAIGCGGLVVNILSAVSLINAGALNGNSAT